MHCGKPASLKCSIIKFLILKGKSISTKFPKLYIFLTNILKHFTLIIFALY